MIIITGFVLTNNENREAIETECVSHSRRSRGEPGCIAHNVHEDCEQPDRAALLAHFALPESGAFVKAITTLSTERPEMKIYEAEEIGMAELAVQASSS